MCLVKINRQLVVVVLQLAALLMKLLQLLHLTAACLITFCNAENITYITACIVFSLQKYNHFIFYNFELFWGVYHCNFSCVIWQCELHVCVQPSKRMD